jgi:tRNA (cmo5U34)-methyltransferase
VAGTEIGLANWRRFQIEQGKSVATAERHIKRFGIEYFPITVGEHLALLKEAGFRTVELLWFSYLQAGFYAIK